MLYPALFCAALLLISPLEHTEGRSLHPSSDAIQFVEQFLERYNDLTLDDLENLVSSPPEEPSSAFTSGVNVAEYPKWAEIPAQSDSTWLRFLKGTLANQKRAVTDRSRRGWNRGCFGLKLDRIGSMSGLGC